VLARFGVAGFHAPAFQVLGSYLLGPCLLGWMGLLVAAATAEAGTQLFEASWIVKAQGNERTGGTGESELYSAFGMP